MKVLTPKQLQALSYIRQHTADTGLPPTVREIARELGITSSCSAQRHLDALERKGIIARERYKYRSIRVLGDPSAVAPRERIAELERENASLRAELAEALAAVRRALEEGR